MRRIEPLANDYIAVYESDVGKGEYCYTPGICVLPDGRLVTTLDHKYPGISPEERGMVFLSDDGEHFQFSAHFPFVHARPFVAGKSLYAGTSDWLLYFLLRGVPTAVCGAGH